MQALHDFLLKRYAEGKRVVVFVEESQSMPLATLEEIRLLSNLETQQRQAAADRAVRPARARRQPAPAQHPASCASASPTASGSSRSAPGEIREYLMFRMRAAGYRGPDLFSGVGGEAHRARLARA